MHGLKQSTVKSVVKKKGLNFERTMLMIEGHKMPIRSMEKTEAQENLELNLSYNITNYLGVKPEQLDEDQIQEAALFIMQKFAGLGLADIWEAFKMVGAKQLQIDIKAYWGRFSIFAIGEMLTLYKQYRNGILQEIEAKQKELNDAARKEAEKEAKNEKARQAVLHEFELALKCKQEGIPMFNHWDQIKSHWAKILFEAGKIEALKGDAQTAIKTKARKIARNQLEVTIFADSARQNEKSEARKMLKDVDADKRNEDFVAMWLNIYSKLRVWEYLKPIQIKP